MNLFSRHVLALGLACTACADAAGDRAADARPAGSVDASAPTVDGAAPPPGDAAPAEPAEGGLDTVGEDAAPPADSSAVPDAAAAADARPGAPDAAAPPRPDAGLAACRDVLFDRAVFAATHNSYSGGDRGSLVAQLDAGVRFIEFDLHDDDFSNVGDYRLGHDAPGDEVMLGQGNPDDPRLAAWLGVVAAWSDAHPEHLPITLGLDLKDELTDQENGATGNPGALNDALLRGLGARLHPADAWTGAWPGVCGLRGKVLVVLSGSLAARNAYRRDVGHNPAVAMNDRGDVVEVHDDGDGSLWYWTGRVDDGPEGRRVSWARHGRYDSGITPAVAFLDDDTVVEVHQSERRARLFARVGRLTPELDLEWGPSVDFDDGVTPTLRRLGPGTVDQLHASPRDGAHWRWVGTLNAAGGMDWRAHERSGEALYDKTRAGDLSVFTGDGPADPAETLRWRLGEVEGRVRYRALMFEEVQPGGEPALEPDEPRMYACSAGNVEHCPGWRRDGRVVRQWAFDDAVAALDPPATFAATDQPFAAWYAAYLIAAGALTEPAR